MIFYFVTSVLYFVFAYEEWEPWGSCTKTCATGRKFRTRTCDKSLLIMCISADGSAYDEADCNADIVCETSPPSTMPSALPSVSLPSWAPTKSPTNCEPAEFIGFHFCTPETPCIKGQGQCNRDIECMGHLTCHRRFSQEDTCGQGVFWCDRFDWHYSFCSDPLQLLECEMPSFYPSQPPVPADKITCDPVQFLGIHACSPETPCDRTQGDCDRYEDCAGNLRCHQRNEGEWCGPGLFNCTNNYDFCYDPFDSGLCVNPTQAPVSSYPSSSPSMFPTVYYDPSLSPSVQPTRVPSMQPSLSPSSNLPSTQPSGTNPTVFPSFSPSFTLPSTHPSATFPSTKPSAMPVVKPTSPPSTSPSISPSTTEPTEIPSLAPSSFPSRSPSLTPSVFPSQYPSVQPSDNPSFGPSFYPSFTDPSQNPSFTEPSTNPTLLPSGSPMVTIRSNEATDSQLNLYFIIAFVSVLVGIIIISYFLWKRYYFDEEEKIYGNEFFDNTYDPKNLFMPSSTRI